MEHRIIDPPRSQFERLLTPLTSGERQLIDFFDEELSPEWEMYIQPHLNGLRPDLVFAQSLRWNRRFRGQRLGI